MALSCSRRPDDSGKTEKQASRTVRIETITITLPLHNEHGSSAGKSVPVLPEMQPLTVKNGLDQIGASFHFPAYFTRPNTEHFLSGQQHIACRQKCPGAYGIRDCTKTVQEDTPRTTFQFPKAQAHAMRKFPLSGQLPSKEWVSRPQVFPAPGNHVGKDDRVE